MDEHSDVVDHEKAPRLRRTHRIGRDMIVADSLSLGDKIALVQRV
jgi:hypothetical protein